MDEKPDLTPREQEIFDLLLGGNTPKEISISLNIKYDTVLSHQKSLYRKLNVHNINELFNKYLPDNSITPELPTFPLVLKLNNNEPWGWEYKFDPDLFFHDNEWKPSPFKLGKGKRLTEWDMFLFTCCFKSDVDLNYLQVVFADITVEAAEDDYFTELSGYFKLFRNIKANVEYNCSQRLPLFKSASSTSSEANQFVLHAESFSNKPNSPKSTQPTLVFTELEIVKL